MQAVLNRAASKPWLFLSLLLMVSLLAATQVGKVEVQVSAEDLLVQDDPEREYYRQVRERFGDEQAVLLYLEDTRLLAKDKLEALRTVIGEIEQQPFVQRVESLFSVPHLKTVEGYLNKEPYLAEIPPDPASAEKLLQEAAKNPFVRNVLLSPNGRSMAAAILLKEDVTGADDNRITHTLARLAKPLEAHYSTHFNIGFPQIRSEISSRIQQEQYDLFPLAVLALLLALFLLLRHLVDILTPILTAGLSILWTFGLMGVLGIPLNVVTSIVPILLIVVGSTEDIHLLSEFRHARDEGRPPRAALGLMSRKMGRTVLFTFITTYVGFLSVGLNRIEVLWQFGLLASTGLLLNFIITILLIPSLLAVTNGGGQGSGSRLFQRPPAALAERYWQWLHGHRLLVIVAMAGVALVAASGIPRIEVNHNPVESLGEASEVRRQAARIGDQLSGLESFSIIIDSGIRDTFLKAYYLEELQAFQGFLEQPERARSTTSFASYLSLLNTAFQELEEPALPRSDDVVNELMIFLDYDRVKGYVSEDYSTARILVRHNIADTAELELFLHAVNGYIANELDPGLDARVTGDSVLTLRATQAMIFGQLQSIGLLLVFIALVISILFTDIRAGLLAAAPNAVPVIVLFGFMGFAEIPLNIGTTMAAAIAIGIAVDDTMHFMLRYNQELKFYKSQSQAMHETIRGEAPPVIVTSVALIAGFLVFTLSDFAPIQQFGLLSALVIATALAADFTLTPIAIASLRLITLYDMLSFRLRHQLIPHSPLFRGMRDWQIRRFILSSNILDLKPGERVFSAGERSEAIFLVMEGGVEVCVSRNGSDRCDMVVDRFQPGDLFGEVGLLASERRKGNAIALEPTKVLEITREGINEATQHHPLIAARMFENIATDISHRWVRFIGRATNNEICNPPKEEHGHAVSPPAQDPTTRD